MGRQCNLTPWKRRAVAATVEQDQADQVFGLSETEGHAVQHTQRGVRRLDQRVGTLLIAPTFSIPVLNRGDRGDATTSARHEP